MRALEWLVAASAGMAMLSQAKAATFDFTRSFSPTDVPGFTIIETFGQDNKSVSTSYVLPSFLPASPELLQIQIDGSYAFQGSTTLSTFVPELPTADKNSVRIYGAVRFAVFDQVVPITGPVPLFQSTQAFDWTDACDMNTQPLSLPNCRATFDHEAGNSFSFAITPPFIDFDDFSPLEGLRLEFTAEYSYLCAPPSPVDHCDGTFTANWEGSATVRYVLVDRQTPVPEPAAGAVLGIALLGLAAGRRMRPARSIGPDRSGRPKRSWG